MSVSRESIQFRLLRFLGRLGGSSRLVLQPMRYVETFTCLFLFISSSARSSNISDMHNRQLHPKNADCREVMQKGIVWSIEPSLSISISVTDDASPQTWSFHLDRLLPRVCDLALQSTNRRIKVRVD